MAFGFDDVIQEQDAALQALVNLMVKNNLIDAEEFEIEKARARQQYDQEDAEIQETLDAVLNERGEPTAEALAQLLSKIGDRTKARQIVAEALESLGE